MCRKRSQYKRALRQCKAAVEQMKADYIARELANKIIKAFWANISKDYCKKVSGCANKVGNVV